MSAVAASGVGAGRLVGPGLNVASPIARPGGSVGVMGCCIEDVDDVDSFRLATEVADEASVGVCRPVVSLRNLRNRSRFLGFTCGISEILRYSR